MGDLGVHCGDHGLYFGNLGSICVPLVYILATLGTTIVILAGLDAHLDGFWGSTFGAFGWLGVTLGSHCRLLLEMWSPVQCNEHSCFVSVLHGLEGVWRDLDGPGWSLWGWLDWLTGWLAGWAG